MRLMRQYDLSKRLQPLNEDMVFSAQNDSHSLEGVGVGRCRGLSDGMIAQRCQAFITAKAASKTRAQEHSADVIG